MTIRLTLPLLMLMPLIAHAAATTRPVRVIDVAPVWAGHSVGFALLTHGDRQFVGYYDAERRMTIAARTLDSEQWTFKILPTSIKWDSHNYIEMTIDDDGHLHVAGNMHNVPLIYFRTTLPLDVESLERVESMVGREESRCTYPRFFRGAGNELIFTYRDGGSGNGNQIYKPLRPRKPHMEPPARSAPHRWAGSGQRLHPWPHSRAERIFPHLLGVARHR